MTRSSSFEREILDPFYHELRTSLTLIQTCTDLLMNVDITDPDDLRNFLQIIRRGGTRIDRLVRDFILLAKEEIGMLDEEAVREPTSVLPPLHLALIDVRGEAGEREIEIVEDVPEGTPMVDINPEHLRMIIERLLSVVLRFAQKDGDAIVIQVKTTAQKVNLVITAEGLPILASDMPHIFERFFVPENLPRSREQHGLGLDMAVVKALVEFYGGRVAVETVTNGNVFAFSLPRA